MIIKVGKTSFLTLIPGLTGVGRKPQAFRRMLVEQTWITIHPAEPATC